MSIIRFIQFYWGEKQMIQNHEAKITKMLNPLLISGIGRLFVAVKWFTWSAGRYARRSKPQWFCGWCRWGKERNGPTQWGQKEDT